jgi:hypothetical protein
LRLKLRRSKPMIVRDGGALAKVDADPQRG